MVVRTHVTYQEVVYF
ncbi:hypothetical protein I307_06620 [Cryptococcus deuterogattii 99/473]|nr:hypothetical protein I307_06620 [Cryptococcus deuterogattii 99/473]